MTTMLTGRGPKSAAVLVALAVLAWPVAAGAEPAKAHHRHVAPRTASQGVPHAPSDPRIVPPTPDMSGGNAAAGGNNANSMSGSNSAGENANGRSSGGYGG